LEKGIDEVIAKKLKERVVFCCWRRELMK